MTQAPRIFLVTGEHSGDALGGGLMAALRARAPGAVFAGVGEAAMTAQGLHSLFPMSDIAVMGLVPVVARARTLLARIRETVEAVLAFRPDVLVIIDSPDFTHRVARRVRARRPDLPVVNYVSPSVWAWRPGRARAMAAYVDHVLALLPFEPEEHRKLSGPPCTYVGHPLIELRETLRPGLDERGPLGVGVTRLLVLPGSRRSVARRHLALFGEVVGGLGTSLELVVPTLPDLVSDVREASSAWATKPRIVVGEADKLTAFRTAHAALAASGTVTLELALAGVPMVAAYRTDLLVKLVRPFFTYRMHSFLLPNLILGDRSIPEFIGADAVPDAIRAALRPLLSDTSERRSQLASLAKLDALMALPEETPSTRAARIVIEMMNKGLARA